MVDPGMVKFLFVCGQCMDLLWTVSFKIWTLSGRVEPGGCRHTNTPRRPRPCRRWAQHHRGD